MLKRFIFICLSLTSLMPADNFLINKTLSSEITHWDRAAIISNDFDNDGDNDIIISGAINGDSTKNATKLFRNDGAGNFVDENVSGFTNDGVARYSNFVVSDFNNDGNLDIAASEYSSTAWDFIRIFLGDGRGKFTLHYSLDYSTRNLAIGDFDKDGDMDLLASRSYYHNGSWRDFEVSKLYLLKNDGQGNMTPIEIDDVASTAKIADGASIRLFDFNNDTNLDFVLSYGDGYGGVILGTYEGDASGNFTRKTLVFQDRASYSSSTSPHIPGIFPVVILIDWDNDGDMDFIQSAENTTANSDGWVFKNDGNGNFSTDRTSIGLSIYNGSSLIEDDLDHDGDRDRLIMGGSNILIKNNGEGTHTISSANGLNGVSSYPAYYREYGVFNDFDGDNKKDLYLAHMFASSSLNLYLTNVSPVIISDANISVYENNTSVIDVVAKDANSATITYSITGGVDSTQFSIDSSSGVLVFNTAPDYETPTDSNSDNIYVVEVTATDPDTKTDVQTLSVNVKDASALITSSPTLFVDENSLYSYTMQATNPDDAALTWSVKSGETLPAWLSLSSGAMVSTLAGSGAFGSVDGIGSDASFAKLFGVAVDASGNVYVADQFNNKIRKITPDGNVSTFAGSGAVGSVDGIGSDASFYHPRGVAVDASGNVYVADDSNHKIRKITPDGNVSTFAGSGASGSVEGVGSDASFYYPIGVAVDVSGNVYVADSNNKIRKITPDGNVSTFAGSGAVGSVDGIGSDASFSNPSGVAVDASGNVYVADESNHKIRKITPDGNVSTFAGSGAVGSVDGIGSDASFSSPIGVAVDVSGNVYVADSSNNKIRKITPDGNVTTLTGSEASLNGPTGVAVDVSGNVYVADQSNNQIKKITNDTTLIGTPSNAEVGVHDVNLTLSDGTNSVEHNFQVTVNNLNDAPTSANASFTIDEDTAKIFATNDFNFTDVDVGDVLESIFITTLPTNGTLKLSDVDVTLNQQITTANISNLVFIPLANANGTPYTTFAFKVNDGDANSTSPYTLTLNVTAIDDVPTLSPISNLSTLEDASDFNVTLVSSDIEGNVIAYSATSSNDTVATVAIVDGKLVVTPKPNATGTITVEVSATANGQTVMQSFTIAITNENDAPSFTTNLSNITVDEDSAVHSYELNATDVDGDELTITVESSDTSILRVSPSWSGVLNQADYSQTLDFNLTTLKDAHGVVTITLKAVDANDVTTLQNFTVIVKSLNDAPTLAHLQNKIVYKNFNDINVALPLKDVDGDTVTYSVTALDPSIVNLNVADNIVTLKSITGESGKTDVNITASDTQYSISKLFTLQILSLEDGDSVEEQGEVSVASDENGTKTTVTVADDNLTLVIQEDTNGSVSHEIDIGGSKTLATSTISGSTVEVTPNGVSTKYTDSDVSLEVNATITGEATHKLTSNGGKTTQASSEIKGAHTIINKDTNGAVQIQTSVTYDANTTISVIAKADGSAQHSVTNNGKTSKATSTVVGARTLITSAGDVRTSAGEVSDNGYLIKAEVVTSSNGKSITRFIRVNLSDETDFSIIRNTLKEATPFETGNESFIQEINGLLYIKTNAPLSGNLIIE